LHIENDCKQRKIAIEKCLRVEVSIYDIILDHISANFGVSNLISKYLDQTFQQQNGASNKGKQRPSVDCAETKVIEKYDDDSDSNNDDNTDVEQTCSICLEVFHIGGTVATPHNVRCRHTFHRECISKWLLKHDECPCCRSNLLEDKDCDVLVGEDDTLEHGLAVFDRLQRESTAVAPHYIVSVVVEVESEEMLEDCPSPNMVP